MKTARTALLMTIVCGLASGAAPLLTQEVQAPQLGQAPVQEVVAAMTLEEKASLVVGTGMRMGAASAADAWPF